MTSKLGIQHYTLDTIFTSLVQAFPDLSAPQLHQAAVAVCYHQARGESLVGVGLLYQRLTVVTDQGVYLQWPENEEALPADRPVDTSRFEL